MTESDQIYMQRALDLASLALGRTSPNPVVGAVIVKDGRIVGEGYHRKAGTPHAEVHALQAAGGRAAGATVYVTLEPCSHFGKTPPCADALIAAGVQKVLIACLDPNPQVAGRGMQKLMDAGIETELGIMETEALRLNEAFFKYIQTGRPFVAVKTAMTLDGKIASKTGDSRWITSADARAFVHQLRNTYDAILVGIGTVLKDDPLLNTRLEQADTRDPVRVVLDSKLELPADSQIACSARKQRSLVFCSAEASEEKQQILETAGCEIIRLQQQDSFIPLETVLDYLGSQGICSLLVEGGGQINASFLEARLADKIYSFIAPKIIGGTEAPSPVGGQGLTLMREAWELHSIEVKRFAKDILLTGYF